MKTCEHLWILLTTQQCTKFHSLEYPWKLANILLKTRVYINREYPYMYLKFQENPWTAVNIHKLKRLDHFFICGCNCQGKSNFCDFSTYSCFELPNKQDWYASKIFRNIQETLQTSFYQWNSLTKYSTYLVTNFKLYQAHTSFS